MNSDKFDFNLSRPSYPMFYDRDFLFSKDRRFFLSLILGFTALCYIGKKIPYEMDRMQRDDRMSNLKDMPAHHFNNRFYQKMDHHLNNKFLRELAVKVNTEGIQNCNTQKHRQHFCHVIDQSS